ncbi:MAG: hypothetical protein P3A58_07765 [Gemmatimonadota bacterium]|nr:hypothetical protein [Gemmatimonadota bacterium]
MPLALPPLRASAIAALAAALAACAGGDAPSGTVTVDGSFARLQNEVLVPSCATGGCHVSGSGQVVLSGTAAYDGLVNALPTHTAARLAGLKRVAPGRPDSSLLYHRLLAPTHRLPIDLGPVMPEGRAPLTAGQVEFLVQWIAAGAPRRGEVADAALLTDRTPQSAAVFQPLEAPAAGSGIQLRVEPFTVAPHFERELFVHRRVAPPTSTSAASISGCARAAITSSSTGSTRSSRRSSCHRGTPSATSGTRMGR